MHTKLNFHVQRGYWKVVNKNSIRPNRKALPMVWSMKRKHTPIGEITKWKAGLYSGGD